MTTTCKRCGCDPEERTPGCCTCANRHYARSAKGAATAKTWRTENYPSYYAENRETVLERNKRWKDANPEKKKASDARWYQANKERHREATKAWCEANPERAKEIRAGIMRRFKERNPGQLAEYCRNRRLLVGRGGVSRQTVWERDEGICGICGEPADIYDWHLDHVIPVSKGGPHTYENVQVSHPICNLRKGDSE